MRDIIKPDNDSQDRDEGLNGQNQNENSAGGTCTVGGDDGSVVRNVCSRLIS